ncbi:MAG: GNAT family N-acetyltransferase [bacterium]|nr:GNAT family N-acetyltransferase [bacterium]
MTDSADPKLKALPPEDHTKAGAVLGRAFRDDPMWGAVFPDIDSRSELLTSMFTALTKATLAARGLAETTLHGDAVALWLPPGEDIGFWAMVKSGFTLPRFAMRLPGADRKRMLALLKQLENRKKALMPQRHWYLSAIGVDPTHQGEGLGSALVRSGLHRADHENTPVYLETETVGNVGFYEHLGFEVLEQVTAVGLDLPVWLMQRPVTLA